VKSEPAILVIFGITGDLSGRYLLPALYHLVKAGALNEKTEILGVTRGNTSTDELFEKVELCVNEVDQICDPEVVTAMRRRTEMFQMNLDDPAAYDALLAKLNSIEEAKGVCMHRVYYLSIPPSAYRPVVQFMGEHGLNQSCQHGEADTRLMVEKPFGHDLESAQKLIAETGRHFKEEQVYRIDHYLAKQPVVDFLKQRCTGGMEREWSREQIAGIDIIAKEKIGIEGRAGFYDPLGALRDFIQSHLIQILGLAIMDKPASLDSGHVHAAKEAALDQITPADPRQAVRGQYRGYRDEVDNQASDTETYAEVTLGNPSERWQGVPLRLLTGKALDERRTEIVAKLRRPDAQGKTELIWPLQGGNAYERVLVDAINGDRVVFASGEEVLASWRILQPVIEAWQKSGEGLLTYKPGSTGPQA
jgi:glucose-6-phosphate 1-dehydrogenase